MNKNSIRKNGMIITLALAVVFFLVVFNRKGEDQPESTPVLPTVAANQSEDEETISTNVTLIVDVKGEVMQPGVYEAEDESRVNDVILLAGGFTEEADVFPVNLAQRVHDEMTITVPKLGEEGISVTSVSGSSNSEVTDKIRINSATQTEIEKLSGIGPAKAQAIIAYREEHGLFSTVEDLLNISGIGEKTLENMRDQIQVP